MLTLAIETSCDETGVALLRSEGLFSHELILNLLSSQVATHHPYGGVVPSLAAREHEVNLPHLVKEALKKVEAEGLIITDIAYTAYPGLEPALLIGRTFARTLAWALNIPAYPVNHLDGHILSALLKTENSLSAKGGVLRRQILETGRLFPAVALLVSGAHTQLYSLASFTEKTLLGETLDDAIGEAFDKVGRMLGLKYPGGPRIEALAKQGAGTKITFPSPLLRSGDYRFSFSGLKTSVLYFLKNQGKELNTKHKAEVAYAFQEAALKPIVAKTKQALVQHNARSLFLGGGVSANKNLQGKLRALIASEFPNVNLLIPQKEFSTDNGAMIALAHNIATMERT